MSAGIEKIAVHSHCRLDDYASVENLASAVKELRDEAALRVPRLRGRTVWMLSSTPVGGGVAEMMPQLVALLSELGIETRWIALRADARFFALTKRIQNLIHGAGEATLGPADRELYEGVSRRFANELARWVSPNDILVVHDPPPLAVGSMTHQLMGVRALWRCHIGHSEDSRQAHVAWEFLRPYTDAYRTVVFTNEAYMRGFLAHRLTVMRPSIDPLDHKNRDLPPTKLVGILANAGLLAAAHPVLTPPFTAQAQRFAPDGRFAPALGELEIGLPFRPIVAQISRWDRLKGWDALLDGFRLLKERIPRARDARQRRRLEILRLVLAGPEPDAVRDDPEGRAVLAEVCERWSALPRGLRDDVAVVVLPMASRKENALMVNSLERCAAVLAQCSLREAFSLTVTEAMWKGLAVLGTSHTGIAQQIQNGIEGRLVSGGDARQIAETLDQMLAAPRERQAWGRCAHQRVRSEFLIFRQVLDWVRLLSASACEG